MPKKIYKKKEPKAFFTKNGKELKSYRDYNSVFSIKDAPKPERMNRYPGEVSSEVLNSRSVTKIKDRITGTGEALVEKFESLKQTDKLRISMISLGINTALLIVVTILITSNATTQNPHNKYAMFSSKPLTSLVSSSSLFGGDPRAAAIDKVFAVYNCPLEGKGRIFVREADNYDIPYWIVAAISFQESSCGRVTPKKDGEESFNAWGWGVWGNNVRSFENWEEGIRTVSRYLSENFFSRGVTDTCQIMRIYTPPSDGSWCHGVDHFGNIIQNYRTPSL